MPNPENPGPAAAEERQMTDAEIEVEASRSRAVGLLSLLTVAMLGAGFFCLWLVQKDAAKRGGDVSSLLLIDSHSTQFILSYFFFAIGTILVAPILVHIALAVRSRRPGSPKLLLLVSLAGPLLVGLALPAFTITQLSIAKDFADGAVHTAAAASKALDDSGLQLVTLLYRFAELVFATAWVMVSLYGMRAGLLTRLTGYVGIAIGAASVFAPPLASILQVFWIGSFSILLLSRGGQKPPAWVLGRAVPWSEVQQVGQQQQDEDPADFAKASGDDSPAEPPALEK
ncbi:MAG: hypothetical protein ACRDKI_05010 [Solirubrobacterales bacterium]